MCLAKQNSVAFQKPKTVQWIPFCKGICGRLMELKTLLQRFPWQPACAYVFTHALTLFQRCAFCLADTLLQRCTLLQRLHPFAKVAPTNWLATFFKGVLHSLVLIAKLLLEGLCLFFAQLVLFQGCLDLVNDHIVFAALGPADFYNEPAFLTNCLGTTQVCSFRLLCFCLIDTEPFFPCSRHSIFFQCSTWLLQSCRLFIFFWCLHQKLLPWALGLPSHLPLAGMCWTSFARVCWVLPFLCPPSQVSQLQVLQQRWVPFWIHRHITDLFLQFLLAWLRAFIFIFQWCWQSFFPIPQFHLFQGVVQLCHFQGSQAGSAFAIGALPGKPSEMAQQHRNPLWPLMDPYGSTVCSLIQMWLGSQHP